MRQRPLGVPVVLPERLYRALGAELLVCAMRQAPSRNFLDLEAAAWRTIQRWQEVQVWEPGDAPAVVVSSP